MAKIPTGNFGYRTPQGGDVTPTPQMDTQATDAAARLGQQVTNIAGQELRRQRAEDERLARQAENVQVMTAHATIQNGLNDVYREVDADVLDGKIDKVDAIARWKDDSAKVLEDNLKGLPPERAALVNAQLEGLQGRLEGQLYGTFRKRDQQDVAGGLVQTREQLERLAATDPKAAVQQWHAAVDTSGPAAGWTAEKVAKEKQSFVETVTLQQFRRAGQDAMQSGSVEAIDEVQKKLAGPEGDAIDPTKRNTLDQTLFGWKTSLEARKARDADKAEREATKRFNTATDTLNKGRDLVLGGAALSPEYIAKMTEEAAGTGLEDQVKDLLEVQKQANGFANLSAKDRAALLETIRARRANPAIGFDPQAEKQFNAAQQIDERLRKRVDDGEAWAAAQSVGVIQSAPLMNIASPEQALQVFQSRMANIGDVETWAGQKISPLQPQEADALGKIVRTLKPDQAASFLGQAGAIINDPERIAAVAKQLGADKSVPLDMAMLYANAKTTEGRYTAQLVLEGAQAIKDKAVRVDGAVETGWRASLAKTIRGAYSNQEVESRMIESAFLIAAAKGGADLDNAVNLATGGIIERNGGKIPLPYGMKEREFEKRVEAITPQSLADQAPGGFVMAGPAKVPLADFVKTLPDARFVHAGQGLYNVRAGNTLVTNERGQRITLKVAP